MAEVTEGKQKIKKIEKRQFQITLGDTPTNPNAANVPVTCTNCETGQAATNLIGGATAAVALASNLLTLPVFDANLGTPGTNYKIQFSFAVDNNVVSGEIMVLIEN